MENIPLWHERDISHSSVERVIFPDATTVLDFMLHRFASLVEGLLVDEERMKRNMELSGGTTFSQTLLLALVDGGMTREDAYAIVQRNAHGALDSGRAFSACVREDPQVKKVLDRSAIDAVFDPAGLLKRVDVIFDRVFGEEK
jgi:adenylosuccinate lyase